MIFNKKILSLIFLADVLVIAFIFGVSGVYNYNVDANDYIGQVSHFANPQAPVDTRIERREFKPLYAWLGGSLVKVTHVRPETAIVFLNILFLIGLSFSFFAYLRLLGIEELPALIGSSWLVSGYPLLKYGLSIGTDMSGWFFAACGAAVGLYGLKKGKLWPLVAASVLGFVGFLGKETGLLGLALVGITLLFQYKSTSISTFTKQLFNICLPALVLEILFVWSLKSRGSVTFFDWYKINAEGIHSFQTIRYFAGIEIATFHILLVFMALGIIFSFKNKEIFTLEFLKRYVPSFLVSLPMIIWPMYITRIMYIQFLFVIPIALYGAGHMQTIVLRNEKYRRLKIGLVTATPILISVVLFLIGHSHSLFDVFSV